MTEGQEPSPPNQKRGNDKTPVTMNRRWSDQLQGAALSADPEVRAMLTLAGYIVTNPDHVQEFAELIWWLQDRHKTYTKRRITRATLIMGVLTSIASLIVGSTAPWLWQVIKTLIP